MTIVDASGGITQFSDMYVRMLKRRAANGRQLTDDEWKDWKLIKKHLDKHEQNT